MLKSFLRKILFLLVIAVIAIIMAANKSYAFTFVDTEEEAEKMLQNVESSSTTIGIIKGTEVDPSEYLTIDYIDDAQKELFDYTFENGVLTFIIKDLDLYNLISNWSGDLSGDRYVLYEKGNPLYEIYSAISSKYIGVNITVNCDGEYELWAHAINSGWYSGFSRTTARGSTKTPITYSIGTLSDFEKIRVDNDGIANCYGLWDDKDDEWFINLGTSDNEWGEIVIPEGLENSGGYRVYNWDKYMKFKVALTLAETATSNKDAGVSVTAKKSLGSELVVTQIEENEEEYIELSEKLEDKEILRAYDVSLTGDYTGDIKVTFDVGTDHNGKMATILHKKTDGTIETFEKTIQNGTVTVTVTELSPFMVAVDKKENATNDTEGVANTEENDTTPIKDNKENATQSSEEATDTETKVSKAEEELDETPKTGGADYITLAIVVVVLSVLGLAVTIKNN